MTKKDTTKPNNEEMLFACEKLRDEYLDGWKRAKADLANYKKEEVSRMEATVAFSNEMLIREIIVVLDSFCLGLETLKKDEKAFIGMQLVASQFYDILKRSGVEKINAKEGDTFDPTSHEATGFISSSSPPDTIAQEISCGYRMNSKILRPAKVVLSKGLENKQK